MRNAQKQEVLGCIDSLRQAHEEIRGALKRNDNALVRNMLSECQEFAVSLGESIEKLEGEGHATVSCLEGYCEALYHVYEELDSAKADAEKIFKTLRKQFLKVEGSAKSDIYVKKEAVFLPYKASMWDSLESVWRAANEDPDCDAYVIPIPYYDKKPDGSFGEMHYEADLYPEYVPIVPYGSYDFEKRRPDMIFIHNPYDECNYVTSVLPFFYSKNLKRFTEKLIYIPYFILGEIAPDDLWAVEGMKHFCLVPGVMNADRVIVQSEDMRLVYIEVLAEASGEKTREHWKRKILGLGSPKVDKVLRTRKEDLEIPEEWRRVIQKPDGTWKKVIFYNTSVTALLDHNEGILEKMRKVFCMFRENKDEVTLLWRPHPLTKATLKSMRPQLINEYQCIEKQYRTEAWGIFDDSVEMERSVILSDAYYGDRSSIVQLYQKIGKPVMIQNVDRVQEKRNYIMVSHYVHYDENITYFIPLNYNALIKYDRKLKCCKFITYIKQEGMERNCLYTKVFLHNNKILAVPMHAKNFAIIDLETLNIIYMPIPNRERLLFQYGYFYNAVQAGEDVYAIGYTYPGIVKISLVNYEVSVINDWVPEYQKRSINASSNFFNQDCCLVDNAIYVTVQQSGYVMKYCINKGRTSFFKLGDSLKGFKTICYDGKFFWLTTHNGMLLKWEKDTECIQKMMFSIEVGEVPYVFSTSLYRNGKLFLFPGYYDYMVIVDIHNNNEIRKVNLNIKHEKIQGELVRCVTEIGNDRFAICEYTLQKMLLYHIETDEIELIGQDFSKYIPDLGQLFSDFGIQEVYENDSINYGLRQYIKLHYWEEKNNCKNSGETYGNSIYKDCIS